MNSTQDLLQGSCKEEAAECLKVMQSSFGDLSEGDHITSSSNGLVWTAFNAYSYHHHLTLRPEDVWFAILTQFSFFVNANAEDLRSSFVAHEGQKELEVYGVGTASNADFGPLAVQMTEKMDENLLDAELHEWIMPDFTTTTQTDKITAAVLMMGAMQKYFSYAIGFLCGIPSVTLLGEKEDWKQIRARIDKLSQYGKEPTEFARLLTPVLDGFIRTFESPDDAGVVDFWSKIAQRQSGGSGPSYFSGWMTAFCFWDVEGKSLKANEDGCKLDGVVFHRVDTDDIPAGYVSVPVKVNDNGHEFKTKMLAGSVGIAAKSSGQKLDTSSDHRRSGDDEEITTEVGGDTGLDTLQPLTGWWIYELKEKDS